MGPQVPATWSLDLNTDGMEVYLGPDDALVLVDRDPVGATGRAARYYTPLNMPGGTPLNLVGEVEELDNTWLHGEYSGLLGGTAVIMDQYVDMYNCVPRTIVRVIRRVNGSAPSTALDHTAFVRELLDAAPESQAQNGRR